MDLEYTIKSENGIHARPASCLAKFAKECPDVNIKILHSGKECKADSIMAIMKLGLKKNDTVTFRLNGPDQETENEIKKRLNNLLADF